MGKASAVMQDFQYSVDMKRELSKKAKLSVFKTVIVPILTYDRESWVMIERIRSQVQVLLFDKMRSSEIRMCVMWRLDLELLTPQCTRT